VETFTTGAFLLLPVLRLHFQVSIAVEYWLERPDNFDERITLRLTSGLTFRLALKLTLGLTLRLTLKITLRITSRPSNNMFDVTWLAGHAKTSYTHHKNPITLTSKTDPKTQPLFSKLIQDALPPCRLNPFLFNGHLQTMYTAIKEAGPPIHYKRRIFESTHSVYSGQFTVDFVVPPINPAHTPDATLPERTTFFTSEEFEGLGSDDSKPMLVCLHGLTGGSHEIYLREVVKPVVEKGWAACVINARGCALSAITTPQLFNSRSTWDVRQFITYLTSIFPNRPLFAVGFSLGANILTNYVGEEGGDCRLKAAVAVSNPWNLEVCNVIMKRSYIGLEVYMKAMGGNMMGLYNRHKDQILRNEGIDEEEVKKCKYLYEFDR
jgi:predicted alpha/beta-fold hydrolase